MMSRQFIFISLVVTLIGITSLLYTGESKPYDFVKGPFSGKILFSSYRSGNWEIWSVQPDGRGLTQLTKSSDEKHYPSCSPEGTKIAYGNNEGEIWIIEKDKKPQKIVFLPENCAHPSWSPDGKKIAFVAYYFKEGREYSDIWIGDLEREQARKLPGLTGILRNPKWSPDGSTILYTSAYWGSGGKIMEGLWFISLNGTDPMPLVSDVHSNIQSDWSPDGQFIVFASDRSGNMDLWTVDRYGRSLKQLTHHKAFDGNPGWSPDGLRICFCSTRNGKMDIWAMDRDGGNPKQLTGLLGSQSESKEPAWCR